MASVPTPEELKKLKVVELRDKLSKLGQATGGDNQFMSYLVNCSIKCCILCLVSLSSDADEQNSATLFQKKIVVICVGQCWSW